MIRSLLAASGSGFLPTVIKDITGNLLYCGNGWREADSHTPSIYSIIARNAHLISTDYFSLLLSKSINIANDSRSQIILSAYPDYQPPQFPTLYSAMPDIEEDVPADQLLQIIAAIKEVGVENLHAGQAILKLSLHGVIPFPGGIEYFHGHFFDGVGIPSEAYHIIDNGWLAGDKVLCKGLVTPYSNNQPA